MIKHNTMLLVHMNFIEHFRTSNLDMSSNTYAFGKWQG